MTKFKVKIIKENRKQFNVLRVFFNIIKKNREFGLIDWH